MMEHPDSFDLIEPADAKAVQWEHRTEFAVRLAAWSGGQMLLSDGAAIKWWPLTKTRS